MAGDAVHNEQGVLSAEAALTFLDEASAILAGSLDYERTLGDIAQLMVPVLADWAAVDVVEPDGTLRQITSGHPDPEQERFLLELRRRYRAEKGASEGVTRVVATGEPELASDVSSVAQARMEIRDDEAELYARLAPKSYLIVPLDARNRTLGALTLLSTREGRHYGERDLAFARHVARRFALAVDNARLYEQALDSAKRAGFMAEAGAVLDDSMDYEVVLNNLARLAVPDFADWCSVSLLDDDGELHNVAIAHADPEKTSWARRLNERYPPSLDPERGAGKVIATGRADVVNDVTDEMLELAARDAEHLELLRELGLRAGVTAPLAARGRILGALSFVSAESGHRYEDADVQMLVELGRRAGVAVENARLYTERSRIAHTLQARLLPSRLPTPPGVRLAARYRAAGEFNEVGGDFYDAFQRSPDEWVVLIGDVSGKGPEAAALTALARYTIRAAALNDWAPAHVLRRLNDTLLHEEEGQFITVALAYVCPAPEGTRVRLVLAGHPPPCVLREGGQVQSVGEPGTLLGIRTDVRLQEAELVLAPGDAMLLYTDGVIEAGPRGAPFGEDGLMRTVAGLRGAEAEELVAAIDAAALDAGPGRARDDVAILAVQATEIGAGNGTLEITRPAQAADLHDLREAVVEFARDKHDVDLGAVRLAVGEACANVVVHAYRRASRPGSIHLRAIAGDEGLVVEVRDDGCGPAPRKDSPGLGLGLPLMARLTRELRVLDREPTGTLVRLTF